MQPLYWREVNGSSYMTYIRRLGQGGTSITSTSIFAFPFLIGQVQVLGAGLPGLAAAIINLLVPAGHMASIVFAGWWVGSAIGSPKKKSKNLSAAVVKAGTEVKHGLRYGSTVLAGSIFAIAVALFFAVRRK